VAWAQRSELSGRLFPPAHAAGRELPGLVIDLDASVVVCHSEKEHAAPTFKKTFGYLWGSRTCHALLTRGIESTISSA